MNVRSDRPAIKGQIKDQKKLAQRDRECNLQSGNLQMNDSTKPSDKPSLPVTRYRSFKNLAVTDCIRFEAGTCSVAQPGNVD
jgi:hypothetical protein